MLRDDGRIALPGGHFIPGTITGKTFKDHLDKWLQQNPDPVPATTTNSLLLDIFPDPVTTSFQLMADDCIHSLEKELFALRSRQEKSVCMRAQKARELETGKEVPSERKVSEPQSAPQQSEVPIIKEITNDVNQPPTHVFVKAKDVTYSPPTSENVAVKPKLPPVKKPEVTYRTSAPIYKTRSHVQDVSTDLRPAGRLQHLLVNHEFADYFDTAQALVPFARS